MNKIVENKLNWNMFSTLPSWFLYGMHVFSNLDCVIYAKKSSKMSSNWSMRNLNFIMMVWYDQFRLWNKNTRTCFRIVSLQHMYKNTQKILNLRTYFRSSYYMRYLPIHTRTAIAIFWVGKRGLIIVLCCRLDNS